MTTIDPVERHLFLEGIFLRYGYDFRNYAESSMERRMMGLIHGSGEERLLDILRRCLDEPDYFRKILPRLTVGTTEFFRDPAIFRALRTEVLPVLKTYPSPKIWIAGCSTGEEVLSLAILLREEGLLSRSTIYATDVNPEALKNAREGIYEAGVIEALNKNYAASGGVETPSGYYTAEYGLVRFDPSLRENVIFSEHNLVTDAPFIEAHLVLCRNVLIYLRKETQNRVFELLTDSLAFRGFLALGSKESIRFSSCADRVETLPTNHHVYRMKPVGNGRFL